jgi:aquaporin Z
LTEVEKPASVPEYIKPTTRYIAELIGTLILVFIGCGSAVIAGGWVGTGYAYSSIAFAFGLAVLAMVYAIGGISGCHINPAITVSMLIAKKISAKDAALYIVFQCIGGIIGAGILYGIAVGTPAFDINITGLGQNGYGLGYNGGYDLVSALIAEVALTFMFVLVVHGSTHQRVPRGFAGLAIGLALTMVHIVGIPITGTSVNPARSLGPAVFVGGEALSQLWLFILAPILGGVLAALVWRVFR